MIKAEIPYKAHIVFMDQKVSYAGPEELRQKVLAQKNMYGQDPQNWKTVPVQDGYDILLNEFILKCQNNYKLPYSHEELCHCRMVRTEKVLNVIKQGVFTTAEVGRVSLAGTGCGSCKKDIEDLTNYLVK